MKIEEGIVVGNVEDKYHTKNPISRLLVQRFLTTLDKLIEAAKAESILEVGCGDGFLTERIRKRFRPKIIKGSDLSVSLVEQAQESYPKIKFSVENAEQLNQPSNSFDLIVACEVLEHLPYPKTALKEIHRVTKKWAVLSVPQEPLWRILNILRLKYLRNFGNTPGHLNHWSYRQFLELVKERGFQIIKVKKPLPWTMVLVRKIG